MRIICLTLALLAFSAAAVPAFTGSCPDGYNLVNGVCKKRPK